MQLTSGLLILVGAAAVARANPAATTTTTGIDSEPTGNLDEDNIFRRVLDDVWVSRVESVLSAADAFTTVSGYEAYGDALQTWIDNDWVPTQTVMATTERPPSNTGDPEMTLEEEAEMMEASVQIFKGAVEVVAKKQYFEDEETQEKFVDAIQVRAGTMETALAEVRKRLGMDEAKTEEKDEAQKEEGKTEEKEEAQKEEGKDGETKDDDESSAGAVGLNARVLGAVLAAGVLAVMAL